MRLEHYIGWALVHSIWEITAVAGGLLLVRLWLKKASARYLAASVALACCPVIPVCTALWARGADAPVLQGTRTRASVPTSATGAAPFRSSAAPVSLPPVVRNEDRIEPFIPILVRMWMVGSALMALRLLGGIWAVGKMRRTGVRDVGGPWQSLTESVAARLGIRRKVVLMLSNAVEVPTTIGVLKAVVLLPASAVTRLDPAHIEALIAHELAHVSRFDYLVNIVQTVVETVLFYHPAVWWISYVVRAEREHCCDDLAVGVLGDRATYARALAGMEGLRMTGSSLAMAAAGPSLLRRIRRLAVSPRNVRTPVSVFVIGALLMVAAIAALAHPLSSKHSGVPQNHDSGMIMVAIRNAVDRKPFADVPVILTAAKSGEIVRAGTTGRDGRFRVGVPSGTYLVHLFYAQNTPRLHVRLRGGDTREYFLYAESVGPLMDTSVHVVDADGRPAANLPVSVLSVNPNYVAGLANGTPPTAPSSVVTNANGDAVVRLPARQARALSFEAYLGNQFSATKVRPTNGHAVMKLRRIALTTIEGRVVDWTGRPASGVKVDLIRLAYPPGLDRKLLTGPWYRYEEAYRYVPQVTGEDGRYRIPNLFPGYPREIALSVYGFLNGRFRIPPLAPGRTLQLPFRLPPEGVIKGVVLDQAERPVAGHRVSLDIGNREVVTDATGRFFFDHVPKGKQKVNVQLGRTGPWTEAYATTDSDAVIRVKLPGLK